MLNVRSALAVHTNRRLTPLTIGSSSRESWAWNRDRSFVEQDRAQTVASIERIKQIATNLRAQVIIQHDARDVEKLPAFPRPRSSSGNNRRTRCSDSGTAPLHSSSALSCCGKNCNCSGARKRIANLAKHVLVQLSELRHGAERGRRPSGSIRLTVAPGGNAPLGRCKPCLLSPIPRDYSGRCYVPRIIVPDLRTRPASGRPRRNCLFSRKPGGDQSVSSRGGNKGTHASRLARTAGAASGCGIWATHFIAMLAYDPGLGVNYNVTLTVLSLLLAAGLTAGGLSVAVYNRNPWATCVGGAFVGGGVACMHYLGMSALEMPGHIAWSSDLVAVSVLHRHDVRRSKPVDCDPPQRHIRHVDRRRIAHAVNRVASFHRHGRGRNRARSGAGRLMRCRSRRHGWRSELPAPRSPFWR